MASLHPSRGRILFEVLCALALAASLAAAWLQTGASALLAASFAATLFGFSHAFGMRRQDKAAEPAPQRVDFAPDCQDEPDEFEETIVAELETKPSAAFEEAESGELADAPVKRARKTKAPRKGRAARKPPEDPTVPEPAPAATEEPALQSIEDEQYMHITPLFEPEPFVRQPRAVVFGRKAG